MAQFIPVIAGYDHWHSSSLCLLDVTTGTVHPCFAGCDHWHTLSLCLQDITIGTCTEPNDASPRVVYVSSL